MAMQHFQSGAPGLDPIWKVNFEDVDRMSVQAGAIAAVQKDPTVFYKRFIALPQALGGRFISADTFKETFEAYSGHRDRRRRYNGPLHNTCAVLASAWLRETLREPREQGSRCVTLITGVPGAGKTSSVLAWANLQKSALVGGDPPSSQNLPWSGTYAIYEGQLSKPETALAKIRDVLVANFHPVIIAIHPRPERALENVLQRFTAIGRGASIHNMARLQGMLPEGLGAVHDVFGKDVTLHIIDRRDFDRPKLLTGWDNLPVLESEISRAHIQKQLEKHLTALRPRISNQAWRQASGLAPQ
jgi:hypothetical protein